MPQTIYPNSINLNTKTNFPFLVLNVDKGQMRPLTKGFRIAHWHEDLQFTYVRRGIVTWQTLYNRLTLQAGEAILFNSKVVHMTRADDSSAYSNILFPTFFLGFYPTSPINNCLSQFIGNPALPYIIFRPEKSWHQQILQEIRRLLKLEKEHPDCYQYRILLHLNQIFFQICKNQPIPPCVTENKTRKRMEQFIHFLHQHYQENLSIEELAAVASVSKAECLRCFRLSINTTPYQYLLELRIAKAAGLLRNTDQTITEIACKIGFNQISNFGKVFKERMGCTPREYRKNLKRENILSVLFSL